MNVEDIQNIGTTFGKKKNNCFDQEIIEMLKRNNVKTAFCSLFLSNNEYTISSIILELDRINAENLINMINKKKGSIQLTKNFNDIIDFNNLKNKYCFFESDE